MTRIIMSIMLSISLVTAMVVTGENIFAQDTARLKKEVAEKNCSLKRKYNSELIFTATSSSDGSFSMVAHDRAEFLSCFEGLVTDFNPKIKSGKTRVIELTSKARGGESVQLTRELSKAIDALWSEVDKDCAKESIDCK